MGDINYLRIAQILGGTLREIDTPSFGVFGAASASVERFRLLKDDSQAPHLSDAQLHLIAKAFGSMRNGYEVDRVLIDPVLSRQFIATCRKLGVKAPVAVINKRLQGFRKSGTYGIKLERTTKASGINAEPYFYAAELGFVQLSYRRRVSVDDVVTDPATGEEFVKLCKEIDPKGRAADFKWAALRLRKMRSFDRKRTAQLLSVQPEEIEENLQLVGSLDRLAISDVPEEKGLFSLTEHNGKAKYLYVGSTKETLRQAFAPFRSAKPFSAISGPFWQPQLSQIDLRVAVVKKQLFGASPRDLSLRLIEERHPLFNLPVHIGADQPEAA